VTDTKFIDFPDLKARVSIEQAAQMLGLNLTKHGSQFRGSCPVHGGGDRTLVVTPLKGFYCFGEKQGGDQISLVAHCRQVPVRDAAAWMLDGLGGAASKPAREKLPAAPQRPPNGLKALDYLQHDHESVKALGLAPETVQAWGAGFAAKGILRGRFAVPIHDREGTLLAYVGNRCQRRAIAEAALSQRLRSALSDFRSRQGAGRRAVSCPRAASSADRA